MSAMGGTGRNEGGAGRRRRPRNWVRNRAEVDAGWLFHRAATHYYPLLGNPDTLTGRLLRELGAPTGWVKMDPVDQFHLSSLPVFPLPANFDCYLRRLKLWFPPEAPAIDAYFADLRQAYLHGLLYYFKGVADPRALLWKDCTVTDKLDQYFRNPRLKTLLMADSPHWGSTAARTSYLFDAMLRLAYFLGNYYPRVSSQAFADDLGRTLMAQNGRILKCAAAQSILIQDGRVRGVRVRTVSRRPPEEFTFYSPVVVSNADALRTYRNLIGERHCGRDVIEHLQ